MNVIGRMFRNVSHIDEKIAVVTQNQAQKIYEDLRMQTIDLLEKRAEAWIGESKLVHAGAARKLAEELKGKNNVAR